MQTTERKDTMPTIDLARVFFEEWNHLLNQADKLTALDDSRVLVGRERVHTEDIHTLRRIAASFERIGDALKKAQE